MKIVTVPEVPTKKKPSKYDADIDDLFAGLKADPSKVYHIADAGIGFIARIYKRRKECPKVSVARRDTGTYVSLRK